MTKLLISILFILFFVSCQKESDKNKTNKNKMQVVSLQKKTKKVKVDIDDDFSDFAKKEEKCDSEEELLKKQFEKKTKSKNQAIKLQGGNDSGCSVN